MKFGKLTSLVGVDFCLPEDPIGNAQRWANVGTSLEQPLKLYIGATGWGMPQWKGKWYPNKAKTAEFLNAYGQQFNTIELNTTHYRTPSIEQVEKWTSAVPNDFRFCPKVLQRISHSRDLGLGGANIPDFCRAMAGFAEKLGCCFMQLPPYFGPDRWPVLERFLRAWPSGMPLAIELRMADWFTQSNVWNMLIHVLAELGHHLVITDVAGRRDVLHMEVISDITIIRFVGNEHPTDETRAQDWITRLSNWAKQGLSTAYLFPHRPDNLTAPELANYFGTLIEERDNINTRYPKPLIQDQLNQMSLF